MNVKKKLEKKVILFTNESLRIIRVNGSLYDLYIIINWDFGIKNEK